MSCVSQTYTSTLTWIIENSNVLLFGRDFCAPEAEVETFNNVKCVLGLRIIRNQVTFSFTKPADETPENHSLIDFAVAFVGTDDSLRFSESQGCVLFGNQAIDVSKSLTHVSNVVELRDLLYPKGALTIRIEMRYSGSNPFSFCHTIRTKIKIERCSFTWSLKNSSTFKVGDTLSFAVPVHLERSPQFTLQFSVVDEGGFLVTHLVLKKHGAYEQRHIASEKKTCDIWSCWNISVSTDQNVVRQLSKLLFFDSSEFNGIIFRSDGPGNNWNPLSETQISCEFSFSDGKYGSLLEQLDYSFPSCQTEIGSSKSILGRTLFKEQKFVDVTLMAGNRSFKAHKAVLSSASPIFNAMFDHDMKEHSSGSVCIDDIKPDTLERMLEFMYTNTVDDGIGFEKIADLLSAANKYQIEILKKLCSSRLVSMLSPQNVCRVLHLAYLYEDENMKKAAKTSIAESPRAVLDSKEWATFMDDCIRGAMAKPPVSASTKLVRRLERSLSLMRQRISGLGTLRFPRR